MEEFLTGAFWLAVGQIILIDILLGGDNAVVIALACRNLPDKQRKLGIIYGTMGAIVLRVILIAFALALLAVPYLKIVGAALLLWIGVQLMQPEGEDAHNINPSDKLWGAVRTVIIADLVMSVDNVLAIAGAAQGAGQQHQLPLVIFGLLVSIPIIVWGSQIVLKLMERFPIIITLGAMLLGWIAGQMLYTDVAMQDIRPEGKLWEYTFAAVGALIVLLIGQYLQRHQAASAPSVPPAPPNA
jgi:YjbE family integral membrane protein